jgi:purine-binding chemotaxis protein CheW
MSSNTRGPIDWTAVRLRMDVAGMEMDDALDPPKAKAKAIMDARAKALAKPVVSAAKTAGVDVVVFTLARETYAVESIYVREVVALTDYTPIPGVPDFVMGVANLRGEVLAVMDLRRFFNLPRQGIADLHRIVVLGKTRAEFGIIADTTLGQMTWPKTDVLPARDVTGMRSNFIMGVTRDAALILDGGKLLADERFTIDHRKTNDTR